MKTGLSLPPSKWSFVGLYPWKNFVVPWQKAGDVYKSSSMGKDGERERDARNSMKRIKLLRYCHVYIYMCIYIYSVRIYIYIRPKKNHVHVHHATSHDGPFIQYLSEVIDFCHLCLADQTC